MAHHPNFRELAKCLLFKNFQVYSVIIDNRENAVEMQYKFSVEGITWDTPL